MAKRSSHTREVPSSLTTSSSRFVFQPVDIDLQGMAIADDGLIEGALDQFEFDAHEALAGLVVGGEDYSTPSALTTASTGSA